MIVGPIAGGEKTVRLEIDIRCTACGKMVSGGIKASARFSASSSFQAELDSLRRGYLCGVCRDRKRTGRNADGATHMTRRRRREWQSNK